MGEKKHLYDAETNTLPPVRMLLGEVHNSETDWRIKTIQNRQQQELELEGTVKRLIAYFKDEK